MEDKVVNRAPEIGIVLSGLLDRSASFWITGQPGIGKTALLEEIQKELQARGEVVQASAEIQIIDDIDLLSELELGLILESLHGGERIFVLASTQDSTNIIQNLVLFDLVQQGVIEQIEIQPLSKPEAETVLTEIFGSVSAESKVLYKILKYSQRIPRRIKQIGEELLAAAKLNRQKYVQWDEALLANSSVIRLEFVPLIDILCEKIFHAMGAEKMRTRKFLELLSFAEEIPYGLFEQIAKKYFFPTRKNEEDHPDSLSEIQLTDEKWDRLCEIFFEHIFIVETNVFGLSEVSFRDPLVPLSLRGHLPLSKRQQNFRYLYIAAARYSEKHWSRQLKNDAIIWARKANETVPWEWVQDLIDTRELTSNIEKDIQLCSAIIEHPRASDQDRAIGYILRAECLRIVESTESAITDLRLALKEFSGGLTDSNPELILKIVSIASNIEHLASDKPLDALQRLERAEKLFKRLHREDLVRSVRVWKAHHIAYAGEFVIASDYLDQVIAKYDIADTLPLVGAQTLLLTQQGKYTRAVNFANTAFMTSLLRGSRGAKRSTEIVATLFLCHLFSGNLDASLKLLHEFTSVQHQKKFLAQYNPALIELAEGIVSLHQGLWSLAEKNINIAIDIFRHHDPSGFLPVALAAQALNYASQGDRSRAKELLEWLEQLPLRSSRILEGTIRVYAVQARIWMNDPACDT